MNGATAMIFQAVKLWTVTFATPQALATARSTSASLAQWLDRYTDPDTLGRRWKINMVAMDRWGTTVQLIDQSDEQRPPKLYRIHVAVTES